MMSLLAGVFAGVGMFFGGLFGMHPSAGANAMGSTTPPMDHHMRGSASSTPGSMHMGGPAVVGTVSSIDGSSITITVTRPGQENATSTMSFTIDASAAKIFKAGTKGSATSTPITISDITVGDRILATGTTTGATMTAKTVVDGVPALMQMMPHGEGMGSSTMGHMTAPMHHMGMGSSTSGT